MGSEDSKDDASNGDQGVVTEKLAQKASATLLPSRKKKNELLIKQSAEALQGQTESLRETDRARDLMLIAQQYAGDPPILHVLSRLCTEAFSELEKYWQDYLAASSDADRALRLQLVESREIEFKEEFISAARKELLVFGRLAIGSSRGSKADLRHWRLDRLLVRLQRKAVSRELFEDIHVAVFGAKMEFHRDKVASQAETAMKQDIAQGQLDDALSNHAKRIMPAVAEGGMQPIPEKLPREVGRQGSSNGVAALDVGLQIPATSAGAREYSDPQEKASEQSVGAGVSAKVHSLLLELQNICLDWERVCFKMWLKYANGANRPDAWGRFEALRAVEEDFKNESVAKAVEILNYIQPILSRQGDASLDVKCLRDAARVRQFADKLSEFRGVGESFEALHLAAFGQPMSFYRNEVEFDNSTKEEIKEKNQSPPMLTPDVLPEPRKEPPKAVAPAVPKTLAELTETAKGRVGEIVRFEDEEGMVYEIKALLKCEVEEEARESAAAAMATAGEHPYEAYYKDRGNGETLEQFVIRAYPQFCTPGDYGAGDSPFPLRNIYQDQLDEIDPPLLSAIQRFAKSAQKKVPEYVLPKSARITRNLSKNAVSKTTASQIVKRAYFPLKRS